MLVDGLSDDTKLPREVLIECIRTRDVAGLFLVAGNLDPTMYGSADLLLQDRLTAEIFSKFDFANSPFNKRDKAKLRFFEAEEMCRETNLRLSRAPLGLSNEVNAVIHGAIRMIDRILGSCDLDAMSRYARFGPGSSLCVKGKFTTEYFKYSERSPTVSQKVLPYVDALLAQDIRWRAYLDGVHPFDLGGEYSALEPKKFRLSDSNKVAFVPKNAKTERSIAIEPYFNVFFQLGFGGLIRERLAVRADINLDSQLRNQALALEGSITGELATIDFSMASDTISRETVRLLLPPSWYDHLDRLRSENYEMEGVRRRYHKFSSMGNGFTFELETLIFYALACSSCEELGCEAGNVSVFGDDVILPTSACRLYEEVCKYLGFKVNDEKSFSNGFFRESCGEDFLKGHRVRPVFCKELRTAQHVVSLANRLSALNNAVGVGSRINDVLCSAVNLLLTRIPRDLCRFVVGPPSEDFDGYIHTNDVSKLAASPLVKWNRHLFCWEHPTIKFRAQKLQRCDSAAALWVTQALAPRHKPISKQRRTLSLLGRLATCASRKVGERMLSDISDFCQELVPREITGRKVGKLSLGRSLVWSLDSTGQLKD